MTGLSIDSGRRSGPEISRYQQCSQLEKPKGLLLVSDGVGAGAGIQYVQDTEKQISRPKEEWQLVLLSTVPYCSTQPHSVDSYE
jgi:hypothetical protein